MNQEIIMVTDSKAIKAISYDSKSSTLFIKFNDSPFYAYANVNSKVFEIFKDHPKKGAFYHQIKNSLGNPKRLDC